MRRDCAGRLVGTELQHGLLVTERKRCLGDLYLRCELLKVAASTSSPTRKHLPEWPAHFKVELIKPPENDQPAHPHHESRGNLKILVKARDHQQRLYLNGAVRRIFLYTFWMERYNPLLLRERMLTESVFVFRQSPSRSSSALKS